MNEMLSSMHNIQSISLYICCICVILPVSNLHVLQLYSCIVNVERDSESKPLESPGSLWMKLLWPSKTIQQEILFREMCRRRILVPFSPSRLKMGMESRLVTQLERSSKVEDVTCDCDMPAILPGAEIFAWHFATVKPANVGGWLSW